MRRPMLHRLPRFLLGAALAVAGAASSAHAWQTSAWPNTVCTGATPISGVGTWNYYPVETAMFDPTFPSSPQCPDLRFAMYYCWTSPVTGVATFLDPLSNAMAIYPGCGCTARPPICCTQNSVLTCSVTCGQQYLIRIGHAFPSLARGALTVSTNGTPCPPEDGACNDCCGARPNFTDPSYANFFTGPVAIMTHSDFNPNQPPASTYVVKIFDLTASPGPVYGLNWDPNVACTEPFRFPSSCAPGVRWTEQDLGSVFGLTLDDNGNIYVAHSTSYLDAVHQATIGTVGSGSLPDLTTSIYKLASNTPLGTPSVFANLPGGSSNAGVDPGLGNLTFSCAHHHFYVSHFGDGRIYSISTTGTLVSAFDHWTNTIGSPFAEAGTNYSTMVPLGERVWAVQVHDDRLYYSVWGQHRNSAGGYVGTIPNRVWSIGLTPAGAFIPNSRRQELQVPAYPGDTTYADNTGSCPVSDISFSPTCRMLLAERAMYEDKAVFGHTVRGLEFASAGASWVPSANSNSNKGFDIGRDIFIGLGQGCNSAGGCDYDFDVFNQNGTSGYVWFTADQAADSVSPIVYGLAGLWPNGGTSSTGIPIDFTDFYDGTHDKRKQGDVEIPCPRRCADVAQTRALCHIGPGGPDGTYDVTFTITNQTPDKTVQYLLFPDPNITPSVVAITPMPPGQSRTVTVRAAGSPETSILVSIVMMDVALDMCCKADTHFDLPDCDCAQFIETPHLKCAGTLCHYEFTLQPLDFNVAHIFMAYEPVPGTLGFPVTIAPSHQVVTVPQYGSITVPFDVIYSGGGGGDLLFIDICVRVFIHTENFALCCSELVCFTALVGGEVSAPCPGDWNHDGDVNSNDVSTFLNDWFLDLESMMHITDINHDGEVNSNDVSAFLNGWFAGCP